MEDKLKSAYGSMTMPPNCARRIEKLLEEKSVQTRRPNQVILRPKTRWRSWSSAAILVCLVATISLGGVSVLVEAQKRDWRPRSSEAWGEDPDAFALSEEGRAFLLAMCDAMPDWESYYVLDDRFWEDFLYAAFTCPEKVTETKADTIAGELPIENGAVLVSRKQAESLASLAMGCDLPELELNEGGRGQAIRYCDGYYHIRLSDTSSRSYTLRKWVSDSAESCAVMFNVYGDGKDKVIGSVRFQLRKADNANGFLVTGKQTQWHIPEEPVSRVTEQDYGISLSGMYFQQSTRGTAWYTACQYYLPWESFRRLPDAAVFRGAVDDTGEDGLYLLKDGYREEIEPKILTEVRTPDGKARDVQVEYVELGEGRTYLVDQDDSTGYYVEGKCLSWWVMYRWESGQYGLWDLAEGPWRLDLATGELTDFWGNVPEEDRRPGIWHCLSQMELFPDGCFLIPSADGEGEIALLYVDPEKGLVYDLEALCGSELDDCVGTPSGDEIFCWKEGRYWRIPRSTMCPESLGKLQENVAFASGIMSGKGASFSVERLEEGGYRVFDYENFQFLTLGNLPCEDIWPYGDALTWDQAEVSPDGRKLLLPGENTMVQILNCDTGTYLTIEKGPQNPCKEMEWLASGEIYMQGRDSKSCTVYTLK